MQRCVTTAQRIGVPPHVPTPLDRGNTGRGRPLSYGVGCRIAHWGGYGRTHIPHASLGKLTMPTDAVQTCVVDFPTAKIPNAKPSEGCNAVRTPNSVNEDEGTVTLGVIAVDNLDISCEVDCAKGFYFSSATVARTLKCSAKDKTPSDLPAGTTNLDSISPTFTCQGLWQPRWAAHGSAFTSD